MKEELLRVLNSKLDDINSDIDSLVELNGKISKEQEDLAYVSGILDLFKENDDISIMNFSRLSKEDFTKILDILGDDVKNIFASPNCNYDGLVYLINGINDGVSLTLTDEQKNGIEYLLQKLKEKIVEHNATIDDYNLTKSHYVISDVEELKAKKEKYLTVLDELSNEDYVSDMALLTEAMEFSNVTPETTIDILKYLLEYNADIYKSGKIVSKVEEKLKDNYINNEEDSVSEEKPLGSFPDFESFVTNKTNENSEEINPFSVFESEEVKEEKPFEGFENNDEVTEEKAFDIPADSYEQTELEENVPTENVENEVKEETSTYPEFQFNDFVKDDFTNFGPLSFYNEEVKEEGVPEITSYTPLVSGEETVNEEEPVDIPVDSYEQEKVEENNAIEEEKVSTSDLNALLAKYDINEDNTYINELVAGDVKNYESVLEALKDNHLIDNFKNNSELLIEVLLYSSSSIIERVLGIIKDDLSTDRDDYVITTNIVIDTIPSIFIGQGGNFENFIENVRTFKDLELNLINLFDFSKEVFVADHETILNNLEIVRKYDIDITYQNVKYLLLLSNIGDRIDYYVESVYEDREKHETFDGLKYINEFTAKLNVVTDETIKRLRFCSENGRKVFGSKPRSLTGDITNLKVNSLDITGDYLSKFFNNEFATLTGDEVREYTKLIHNSSNVGNYDDELDIIEKYHNGSRYIIAGINISYNKVLRNYSILRSYGIDNKKALHFAVCYNLVITKDEYDKLKTTLDNELGGNW